METGRFQPPIEHGAIWARNPGEGFAQAATQLRLLSGAGAPFGAEGLSVSFVRAAYGATAVNKILENLPGDLACRPYSNALIHSNETTVSG
ncbi:hypothetical protein SAMN02745215_01396 [Desulfitobacterium chlororespirans DSM 11544]|uniref:Uncharacterized protein n=1 Tax=Desulfitobacterium chlororespirans DSM 11544 TaxID=1121395 RepID=A0A1M7T0T0_9FIRM|nr:hypothetical protein SAMN02745215_01396 [Desulfitobacterium chlororespirans DSM 11544]